MKASAKPFRPIPPLIGPNHGHKLTQFISYFVALPEPGKSFVAVIRRGRYCMVLASRSQVARSRGRLHSSIPCARAAAPDIIYLARTAVGLPALAFPVGDIRLSNNQETLRGQAF